MTADEIREFLSWEVGRLKEQAKKDHELLHTLSDEQIKHDGRIAELRGDVDSVSKIAADVPVLHERVNNLLDGWKALRTALYAAAVGLFSLAAAILFTGTP